MTKKTIIVFSIIILTLITGCSSPDTIMPSPTETPAFTPQPTSSAPSSSSPSTLKPPPVTTLTTSVPPSFPATDMPTVLPPPDQPPETTSKPCVRPVLTYPPMNLDKIAQIVTLGNMNPPSHTFPTDHIYFYITRPAGNPDRPDVADIYAPADLPVTELRASVHVNAGFTDYTIVFQPCESIIIMYGHVSSLNSAVFGDTADYSDWFLENEYSTGGETFRSYIKRPGIPVNAGDLLGTAGGNPGQWALDMNAYDLIHYPEPVANPQRWDKTWYLNAICPLELYEPGPLLDSFIALVNRDPVAGVVYPWGEVIQDVPGTAQGCWFLEGMLNTYPEDPHLALVHSNIHPAKAALSVGTSVSPLRSIVYEFTPLSSGFLNRDFRDITPDGNIYGYQSGDFNGIIIIFMPDAAMLYIEALPGASTNHASWAFTENKVIFVR